MARFRVPSFNRVTSIHGMSQIKEKTKGETTVQIDNDTVQIFL